MKKHLLPLLLLVLVCAAAGAWLAHQVGRTAPQLATGTWLPRARDVGAFSLTDQNGAAFTAQRLQGAPTLVFFGFTHCPDVCPLTLLKLAKVKESGVIPHLRVLFISVDPGRDTPALLAQYVHAFDPDIVGATGTPAALATVTHAFGVAYERIALPGGDYTMDHSATVFLMDARGHNVAVFTPPFDVKGLAADLRRAAPRLG